MMPEINLSNNENLDYLIGRLTEIQASGKISGLEYERLTSNNAYEFKITFYASDERKVEIYTDAKTRYKTVFESFFEEFTDYIQPNTDFHELVDWALRFVNAYINNQYVATFYKNKKSGSVDYGEIKFVDKNVGSRSIATVKNPLFPVYKLLRKYEKIQTIG